MNINIESQGDDMTKHCPKCKKPMGDRNDFDSRACFNEYHGVKSDNPVAKTMATVGRSTELIEEDLEE